MAVEMRACALYAGLLLLFVPWSLLDQTESQVPKISVRVDLVSLDVEVLDQDKNLVMGLTPADFVVEENGKPMEISNFALSRGLRVNLAIVMDKSALSNRQLRVCKKFLHTIAHELDRSDQLCLYTFDARDAYLEQDLTSDRPLFLEAIDNIGVLSKRSAGILRELFGPLPMTGLAIDMALHRIREIPDGKKALLVISNRFRGLGPVTVEHIQQSNCTLLTLAFSHKTSLIVGFGDAINTRQLMRESGGRQFSAETKNIESVCRRVANSLKNYYSIGYLTTVETGDIKPRKIRVRVPGRDYKVYFRHTYIPQ